MVSYRRPRKYQLNDIGFVYNNWFKSLLVVKLNREASWWRQERFSCTPRSWRWRNTGLPRFYTTTVSCNLNDKSCNNKIKSINGNMWLYMLKDRQMCATDHHKGRLEVKGFNVKSINPTCGSWTVLYWQVRCSCSRCVNFNPLDE